MTDRERLFQRPALFFFLLSIGLIAILSQTWRASLENPVIHLRTE